MLITVVTKSFLGYSLKFEKTAERLEFIRRLWMKLALALGIGIHTKQQIWFWQA
jgi:hypothetical protein